MIYIIRFYQKNIKLWLLWLQQVKKNTRSDNTPRNVKQLRGFLGLINFYSKFSSKHAEETVPLLHLIKKGLQWKWDENTQCCFDKIKKLFSDATTLYFPDPKKPYYLETDASNYALGAILYHKNNKQEKKIITLASRTLKGPEISYFTTEKELLAIVCPGKDNVAADVLSRQHPEKSCEKKEKDTTQIYINALKYECSKELENNLKTYSKFNEKIHE